MKTSDVYVEGVEYLVDVIQKLSLARSLEEVIDITRRAARKLTGADGATFVLRERDLCYYVDEDAIAPLWKGKKFPMSACVSGWAMLNRQSAVIEDIYQDARIPADAYRPTFVKSLAMVPIRQEQPIGAIGNYWAQPHQATAEELRLLEALANSTSIALENVQLLGDLQAANASLERNLLARDEFLSIASHELKTPLSALNLQLQLTARHLNESTDTVLNGMKNSFELSLRQLKGLTNLVERLLDVSRLRLEKIDLEYAVLNCSELVKKVVEQFLPQLAAAGCRVSFDLEPQVEGQWDGMRIEQIVSNLLSNVVKHAPGSGVTVSLRRTDRESIVLSVQDTGPGISREMQQRLFRRFERGVSARHVSGLGLGLFITKGLVDAHRGSLSFSSEAGEGATFTVELPNRTSESLRKAVMA